MFPTMCVILFRVKRERGRVCPVQVLFGERRRGEGRGEVGYPAHVLSGMMGRE